MTQEPNDPEWSTRLALSVAGEVRRHRQRQGMSAQQLSDRCAEFGAPIQRSVLANLESGRRTTVTIAEVLVLAAALEVSPAALIVPAGYRQTVEILPGVELDPLLATDWLGGYATLMGLPLNKQSAPLPALRHHEQLTRALRRALQERVRIRAEAVEDRDNVDDRRREMFAVRSQLREVEGQLGEYREGLRDVRLADRPPEPPEVTELKGRVRELRARESQATQRLRAAEYVPYELSSCEATITNVSVRIAKHQGMMAEKGWLVPVVSDDLSRVIEERSDQEDQGDIHTPPDLLLGDE